MAGLAGALITSRSTPFMRATLNLSMEPDHLSGISELLLLPLRPWVGLSPIYRKWQWFECDQGWHRFGTPFIPDILLAAYQRGVRHLASTWCGPIPLELPFASHACGGFRRC
jgi:hypothetical protein